MIDHMTRQQRMQALQGFSYKKAVIVMLAVFVIIPLILLAMPYLSIGLLFLAKLILKSGM